MASPDQLQIDGGQASKSAVFNRVMNCLGIEVIRHMPKGSDAHRTTARAKGKVERPFRTVKEAHQITSCRASSRVLQVRRRMRSRLARRPTHHAGGIEIDHDSQIGKALQSADVGDVRHPSPIGSSDIELPIQNVVDRQGWLATVAPRPTLVADLRLDTRQLRQPGDTVRAAGLALIRQVVVLR